MSELTREQAAVLGEARAWRKTHPGPPVSWPQVRERRLAIAVDVLEAANSAAENLEGRHFSRFLGRSIDQWVDISNWLYERTTNVSGTLVDMAERIHKRHEDPLLRPPPWLTNQQVRDIVREEVRSAMTDDLIRKAERDLGVGGKTKPSTENFARGGVVDPKIKASSREGPPEAFYPYAPKSAREPTAEDRATKLIAQRAYGPVWRTELVGEIRDAESAAWDRAVAIAGERAPGEYGDDILKLKVKCHEAGS